MQTAHNLLPPPIHPSIQRLIDLQSGTFSTWSDPVEITQERIDLYARATGDDQWIHTDPVRAKTGPFKGTVAQGGLIVALTAEMLRKELQALQDLFENGVIFSGTESKSVGRVAVGESIQARGRVAAVEPSASTARMKYAFEIRGGRKLALVATGEIRLSCIVLRKKQ